MKKIIFTVACLVALAACSNGSDKGIQIFRVAPETVVWVSVHGVPATSPVLPTPPPGEPGHRILQSPNGKVLFAYDLAVHVRPDGGFLLRLIPVKTAPSFRAVREIAISPGETAAVDILENIRTGEKVYDDFRFPRGLISLPSLSGLLHGLGLSTNR